MAGEVNDSGEDYRLIRGETVSLRANKSALEALDQMVRDGVRAFPKRGLEIGGLLTGPANTPEIRLDTVCPLPMEYRTSPAFRPTPADLLFIKQSVAGARPSEMSILGHFRSHTSGEPGPSDVDQNVASLLNLSEALLLLIPASIAGVEPARLYRAGNGTWTFLLSFPLIESPPEELADPARGLPPDNHTAGLLSLAGRSRRYPWILAALAAGLTCGAVLGHSVWRSGPAVLPTRAEGNSEVHLAVRPSGSALTVQWNPTSIPVAQASSGILAIQDGGRRLQIPLDHRQLERGSTIYYPESGWVELTLEIYRDGTHFTGQTVAMATGLSTPPPPVTSIKANPPDANGGGSAAQPKPAKTRVKKALPARKNIATSAGEHHRGTASRSLRGFDPLDTGAP